MSGTPSKLGWFIIAWLTLSSPTGMIFQLWYGFQLLIPIPCSSWHEHCWFHDGPATLPWQSTSRRGCNPPTTHPLWACQWWFPERDSIESLHFHASNMPAAPVLRSSQMHFWRTVPAPLQLAAFPSSRHPHLRTNVWPHTPWAAPPMDGLAGWSSQPKSRLAPAKARIAAYYCLQESLRRINNFQQNWTNPKNSSRIMATSSYVERTLLCNGSALSDLRLKPAIELRFKLTKQSPFNPLRSHWVVPR